MDYAISLTETENDVLVKIAELLGKTPEEIVNTHAKNTMRNQILQQLNDQAVDKVKNMTVGEKITLLS